MTNPNIIFGRNMKTENKMKKHIDHKHFITIY
jgi:hypothetical protein